MPPKNFDFFCEKTSQYQKLCRKNRIPYLNTCITYIKTLTRLSAPYVNTCIAYLNTLSRLLAPYLNTCITYLNTLSRLSALSDSATNQNQVSPESNTRVVTRELSAPGRPFSAVGSNRLAIAYLNT